MLCAACGIEIERFTADPRKCAYGSYGDSCDWASACCNCAKKKGWTMQPCRICQTRADKELAPSTKSEDSKNTTLEPTLPTI